MRCARARRETKEIPPHTFPILEIENSRITQIHYTLHIYAPQRWTRRVAQREATRALSRNRSAFGILRGLLKVNLRQIVSQSPGYSVTRTRISQNCARHEIASAYLPSNEFIEMNSKGGGGEGSGGRARGGDVHPIYQSK